MQDGKEDVTIVWETTHASSGVRTAQNAFGKFARSIYIQKMPCILDKGSRTQTSIGHVIKPLHYKLFLGLGSENICWRSWISRGKHWSFTAYVERRQSHMKMTIVTHSTVINLKAQAVAVFAADCKHVIHILRGKGPEGVAGEEKGPTRNCTQL